MKRREEKGGREEEEEVVGGSYITMNIHVYTRTWDNEIEVVYMGRETEEGKAKEKNVMYSQGERERVERRKSKKEREMLNRDSDTYIHTYIHGQIDRYIERDRQIDREGR